MTVATCSVCGIPYATHPCNWCLPPLNGTNVTQIGTSVTPETGDPKNTGRKPEADQ